jgi:hypothetical protein
MVDAIVRRMAVDQPDFFYSCVSRGRAAVFANLRERSRKASQGLEATGFSWAKAEIRELSVFCNGVPKAFGAQGHAFALRAGIPVFRRFV